MRDAECIFCKIAAGDIPSNTIYEDADFRAFLDLGPATKGHTLIVPKNHYKNLLELSDDTCEKALKVAKKVANQMVSKLGCAGVNMVQNNGEAAGQTVNHFHIHMIPRYGTEPKGTAAWEPQTLSEEEMNKIKDQLKF